MQNENCGIKEFDYRFKESKPTITLPINYFSVKSKTKPETLLYNINVQVNSCDTSNIFLHPVVQIIIHLSLYPDDSAIILSYISNYLKKQLTTIRYCKNM